MMDNRLAQLESIAGPVSRETFEKLLAFEAAFLNWNRVTNLIAQSTVGELWSRHILDSAQLLPFANGTMRWLDLGSGGGFPAVIMAILMADRPGVIFHLVESNRKKASFLQSVAGQLELPIRVHPIRIETASATIQHIEIVSSRALTSLDKLLHLASPWLSHGGRGLFHKGRDFKREVDEAIHKWDCDLIEHPSRVDPSSVILEITALRRRP